ncbi:hypothetical protein ABMB67_001571 [Halalkalibacter oceani]
MKLSKYKQIKNNIIEYIKYAIVTVKFNHHYRKFYNADIGLLDNCSYSVYKKEKRRNTNIETR